MLARPGSPRGGPDRGMIRPVNDPGMGPERAWYPLCRSRRLGRRPRRAELRGRPVVLFREGDGRARALLDRCPHRGAPLSAGRLAAEGLRCGYHGWLFDGEGRCREIPGLDGEPDAKGRRAEALAVRESHGLVFAWAAAGEEPVGEPFPAPHDGEAGFRHLDHEMPLEAGLHAVVENILDVPHTAWLHGGLFRKSGRSHEITAVVRRRSGGVEAEYLGEPRPEGFAARFVAPRGGEVVHVDRFVLPSVAQVEYSIGADAKLVSTSWLLPEAPRRTRLFARISYRTAIPGWLLLPVFAPLAWLILRQDAAMLRRVSRTAERFGGERHSSTELDLLGAEVARLLRGGAEEPETGDGRRISFRA